jgi:uncharacterized protein YndB with AHSA1/START domain
MKRATTGRASIHIDASPERVYDLVTDITRMGEWSPETRRCEWIDGDRAEVGARFKGYNRRGRARWSNTLEVINAHRGHEFAFRRAVLHCGVCDWRYQMQPDGTGTYLTESYEVTKPDWSITNWFNGLMLRVEDRDVDLVEGMNTTLARIKETAETSRPAAPLEAESGQARDQSTGLRR